MLNYLWTAMLIIGVVVGAFTGNMQNISNAVVTSAQEAVDLCITMLGIMVMWTGVMKIAEKSGLLEKMTSKFRPVIRFLFPNIPDQHPAGEYIATNCVANILGLGWAATPAGLKAMTELKKLNEERCAVAQNDETAPAGEKRPRQAGNARALAGNTQALAGNAQALAGNARGDGGRKKMCKADGNDRRHCGASVASNEMCTFLILNISSLQLIPVSIIAYRSQYGSANPTAIVGPAILATLVSTVVAVVFIKLKDRRRV